MTATTTRTPKHPATAQQQAANAARKPQPPTPAAAQQADEAARARAAANGEPTPARTVKSRPVGSAPGTATKKTVGKPSTRAEHQAARKATGTRQAKQTTKAAPKPKAEPKPKAAPKPKEPTFTKSDARRDLATRVILAVAAMLNGSDQADLFRAHFSKEEAAETVSKWLHHLPADREVWVAHLPAPDRSDWR